MTLTLSIQSDDDDDDDQLGIPLISKYVLDQNEGMITIWNVHT